MNRNKKLENQRLLQGTLYFQSVNGLTIMVMKKGGREILNLPLTWIEDMLPENMFCRVHRSYLVNSSAISEIRHYRSHLVALVDEHRIPVSRRKRKLILDSLETI